MLKNCKDWANIRIEIRPRFGFFCDDIRFNK